MKLIHRNIDLNFDKEYILERHCRVNYECDCPWKRKMPYEEYRNEWFSLKTQIKSFIDALIESIKDNRTIAEIIENEEGIKVAYLWVPFYADVQDIYVEEEFRNTGIAYYLMEYAENKAKDNGAKVIRSGTGCENNVSIQLHNKLGYYQYRYEFGKLL